MGEAVIYLVYGYELYEMPCEPVRAFATKPEAEAFLERCRAYHATVPRCPIGIDNDDNSEEEWDAYVAWRWAVEEPWQRAHPAGPHGYSHYNFNLMEVPLDASACGDP